MCAKHGGSLMLNRGPLGGWCLMTNEGPIVREVLSDDINFIPFWPRAFLTL